MLSWGKWSGRVGEDGAIMSAAVVIVCRRFVTQSTCGAAAERGSAVPRALVDGDGV